MRIPFKNAPIEFNQRLLYPSCIFDLLPKDHDCFVLDDLFKQIDISIVEGNYSYIGQNAYNPRIILGIMIYAYSHGLFSSRQIEKRCHQDLAFMYISHLGCPNFRVLSDFRKNNFQLLADSFKQSALLAKKLGMVSFGHVSLDGSKFKANSSKHKAMSYEFLKKREEELVNEIKELINQAKECDQAEDDRHQDKTGFEIPEELKVKEKRLAKIQEAKQALEAREQELNPNKKIADAKQISFADKESRIMGKKGQYEYAYNAQISVDEKSQIIVGQHLSQNANDKTEVEPALEQIHETMSELPDKISSDNGYLSGSNLEKLNESGVDAYVATGRENKKDNKPVDECNREIKKADFEYDSERDCFICPGGQMLDIRSKGEAGNWIYQARKEACEQCMYRWRCCKSGKGEPRTINTDDMEPLRQHMIEKMRQQSSKEVYKKRKVIVEPVFGQIKNGGFRGFLLRGHRKASGEFSLVCCAHNLMKIARALLRGEVRLETGKMEATMA